MRWIWFPTFHAKLWKLQVLTNISFCCDVVVALWCHLRCRTLTISSTCFLPKNFVKMPRLSAVFSNPRSESSSLLGKLWWYINLQIFKRSISPFDFKKSSFKIGFTAVGHVGQTSSAHVARSCRSNLDAAPPIYRKSWKVSPLSIVSPLDSKPAKITQLN